VKSVLTNDKIFLNFAIASVIESLRRNPELCNFVLNDISNNNDIDRSSYGCNYLSLMLPGQQRQQSFNDIYSALILEAEKLYNELITELTNRVIAAAATARKTISSLPLPLPSSNNSQKLNYENDKYQSNRRN
jgi:hypothetical protein